MIHTDGTPTIANCRAQESAAPDFTVDRTGDLFLLTPQHRAARTWITENVDLDEAQFWGHALVVEHGYIVDLVDGIHDTGYVVR
jgi:hypothetical protein